MKWLMVGLGGGLGSMLRFWFYQVGISNMGWRGFPAATFSVNVIGCFLIGILAGISIRLPFRPEWTWLIGFGFLGGFTTFSAFGLETFQLFRLGEFGTAAANVTLSLFAGLVALWLGDRILGLFL